MTTKSKKIAKKALKVNDQLIQKTEKTILKSFDAIERTQSFTDKNLKKGFEKSAMIQDRMFNGLEKSKGMIWNKLNKTLDFIGVK